MSDIALEWDPAQAAADLVIEANDLKTDAGIRTAVLLSVFLDRRAEEGDVLPEGQTDRRGWWADEFNPDRIGSRLWLLERSKETPDVLARAVQYTREALQWLVDDLVAERVDVVAEYLRPQRGVALAISIYRPALDPVRFRLNRTWAAEAARINA